MSDIKSISSQKKSKPQELQAKRERRQRKNKILFIAFITCITSSIVLQVYFCYNWQHYSSFIFNEKTLSDKSNLSLLKQSLLQIALLEFLISLVIMQIRIFSQSIHPVTQSDPLYISLLNRILNNNIQQGLIFFGLYSYIIITQNVETRFAVVLPMLFLVGRIIFALTYVIATAIRISTIRSLGFAFTISVNLLMLQKILGYSSFFNSIMIGSN